MTISYPHPKLRDEVARIGANRPTDWIKSESIPGLVYRLLERDDLFEIQYPELTRDEFVQRLHSETVAGVLFRGGELVDFSRVKELIFCRFEGSWDKIDLSNISLDRCDFTGCDINSLSLVKSSWGGGRWEAVTVEGCWAAGTVFENLDFVNVTIGNMICGGSRMRFSPEVRADLRTVFESTNFQNTEFDFSLFASASFLGCDMTGLRLNSGTADHVSFDGSELSGLDMTGMELTCNASFRNVGSVAGLKIRRETLDALDGYGGLTVSQRRSMKIIDDVAVLRGQFGGFWTAFHLAALGIFLSPYIYFALSQYVRSTVQECTQNCETILHSLGRFVWSGGTMAGSFHPSFLLFVILTVYNLSRGLLLFKTKQIELHLSVAGVYPDFSLAGGWKVLANVLKVGLIVNVFALMLHVYHFLSRLVPVQ